MNIKEFIELDEDSKVINSKSAWDRTRLISASHVAGISDLEDYKYLVDDRNSYIVN